MVPVTPSNESTMAVSDKVQPILLTPDTGQALSSMPNPWLGPTAVGAKITYRPEQLGRPNVRMRGVYVGIHQQIFDAVERLIPRHRAWLKPSGQGMHLLS